MAGNAVQTGILRLAALKLGSAQDISSINDSSELATAFKAVWDQALDSSLVAHPWNPAVRVRALDRDSTAPADPRYAYRYRLSSLEGTCLRWLPWDVDSDNCFDAEEEDGFLLTNEAGPLYVRYIWRNATLENWAPLMREVLANRLAYWISYSKTQLMSVTDRLQGELDDCIDRAKLADGLATGRRKLPSLTLRSRRMMARRTYGLVG